MAAIQEKLSVDSTDNFPDEYACRAYLIGHRWPHGVSCPRCGSSRVRPLTQGRTRWNCLRCGKGGPYRFSHLAGTLFENSKIPLNSWFRLIRLLLSNPDITVMQARDEMDLRSYKTAWYMLQRLRVALQNEEFCRMIGVGEGQFANFMRSGVAERSVQPPRAELAHP